MTTTPYLTEHPYRMYDNIFKQPAAISRVLEEEREKAKQFAHLLKGVQQIHIVGIGTSWHAALVGEFLLRTLASRHDARAWNSFEFTSTPPSLSSNSAVIVLSHRGSKQFSLQSLQLAKQQGAVTAIVTGIQGKVQEDLCNAVFRTSESETSSAFTWSHTTSITVLTLISVELGLALSSSASSNIEKSLANIPHLVETALALEPKVKELIARVKDYKIHYFVGHGPNISTAYEVALKIKETSYELCEGFQLEQFLHGPFCAVDTRAHVFFIDHSPNNPGHSRTQELISASLGVGAYVSTLSNVPNTARLESSNHFSITLPGVEEAFTPIVDLVVLQLFTYWLAIEKGTHPDTFRNNEPLHHKSIASLTL